MSISWPHATLISLIVLFALVSTSSSQPVVQVRQYSYITYIIAYLIAFSLILHNLHHQLYHKWGDGEDWRPRATITWKPMMTADNERLYTVVGIVFVELGLTQCLQFQGYRER